MVQVYIVNHLLMNVIDKMILRCWSEASGPAWMDNHRAHARACMHGGFSCAVGAKAVLSYFDCYMLGNFLEA